MCGIFGILYRDRTRVPDIALLRESARRIAHRGPDASGVFSEPGIGLAHTRLSLLDLEERSDQPMWDESGRHAIVFNGEIYNFRELRDELAARGVEFKTTGDTEVLLQCLIVLGVQTTLARLRGMFAFAFYDRRERTVTLARDRFGIKPMLIYQDDEKLIFASEVKSIMPWVALRPNGPQMIRFLMNLNAPVRDSGFFSGIEIAPAGSVTTVKIGSTPESASFCRLPEMIDAGHARRLEQLTPEQAVDLVDEQLNKSVERMMFADAPVGALCSGGG